MTWAGPGLLLHLQDSRRLLCSIPWKKLPRSWSLEDFHRVFALIFWFLPFLDAFWLGFSWKILNFCLFSAVFRLFSAWLYCFIFALFITVLLIIVPYPPLIFPQTTRFNVGAWGLLVLTKPFITSPSPAPITLPYQVLCLFKGIVITSLLTRFVMRRGNKEKEG